MACIIAHELKEKIDFQILIYPTVIFGLAYESYKEFTKECYILTPEILSYYVNNLADNPAQFADHFSPINYKDFSKLSKCLIIAAELDPLIDNSKHYYEKLKQEHVECSLRVIKGVVHSYFSSPLMFKNAFAETENCILQFFDSF